MQKLQKPENALGNDAFKSWTTIQTILQLLSTSYLPSMSIADMLGWQPPPQQACLALPINSLRGALLPITINQKPIPIIFPAFKLFTFFLMLTMAAQFSSCFAFYLTAILPIE